MLTDSPSVPEHEQHVEANDAEFDDTNILEHLLIS